MKCSLAVPVLLLGAGCVAFAGSICPAGNGTNPFPHNPDDGASGCNVVITINANGSVTTTVPDTTPYELSEDVLVGVKNNSSTALPSLAITGNNGNDVFGFDGDGICTYTFVGSSYCSAAAQGGQDPQDYQGPTSTFSNISADGTSGTVNFSPAVPGNGGSTYFSLEGLPTANLTVNVGGGPGPVPAPSSIGLIVIGFALVGAYQLKRRLTAAA